MTVHGKLIGLSAATLLLSTAPARAWADDAADAEALKAEVKKLREEVEALKGKADEAEVKAKDAVVAGDIPGSFRIPGTEISLRLYGFAELNWVHDLKGDASDVDYSTFAPYLPLRNTANAERRQRDYFTARTSRLGLEMGSPTRFGVLSAKIEGDFNNEPRTGNTALYGSSGNVFTQQATSSYGFRIRQAYGSFGGLLIGMTWSTFMDVDGLPETVDFNGPIGGTFIRQPVIRYTYGTPDYGGFTVALENSSSYVLFADQDADGNPVPGVKASSLSRFPDLVLRWDKGFSWGSLNARAVTTEHRIDDGAGEKASRRGWGVGGSAFLKVRETDYFTVGVTFGDGIGRYLNYVEGALYDPSANVIRIERAIGVVAGYQFKPGDWVRVNLAYGMTRNFNNEYTDEVIKAGLHSGLATSGSVGKFAVNRMVQQLHLGPIFTPLKGVDLGIEGIWGQRETLAKEKGDMVRFNFSAKYYIN